MKFFSHCTTLDEVRSTYQKLAFKHHPDRGGDTATMQAIKVEFALMCALFTEESYLFEDDIEQQMKFPEDLYTMVFRELKKSLDILFETIHHKMQTKSGDITPEQHFRLEEIINELSELIVEQVWQNME